MADEDNQKAEKLAAAKKRFEQLKKEQQKKGKKGASKKKLEDDKAGTESQVEDATTSQTVAEEPSESLTAVDDGKPEATTADDDDVPTEDAEHPAPGSQPSLSLQSKQRSESFRHRSGSILTDTKAGPGPMSPGPGLEVQDLYKKQATRIEELEKENTSYKQQQEEGAARLAKADDELESLREGNSELAEYKSKATEVDRLGAELATVHRQLAQAQHAAKVPHRRVSGASPDVSQQLASKTSTIESLELELSNVRNQSNGMQSTLAERDASAKDLEDKVNAAETATESYKQELDQLKVSMAFPSDDTKAANEDPEALTKRITVLESDLRTANANLDAAQQRATTLEQKIEALTKLHKDASAASASKDKELAELRNQLKRRDRPSHVRDASEFELGEEETEAGALHTRIRALEAENFDLRRGVWRDKRAELQPGMEEDGGGPSPEYEDVDLNGPYTLHARNRGSLPRQGSTFQDVITSGISAFTGRPREPPASRPAASHAAGSPVQGRKQSLGLLSDDGGFDEEAFRLAQEEDARRRVERVKEVKRGLEKWKGWRVDLTEQRQRGVGGGRDAGPVFEL
ncbi:hypothetical protein LTR36_001597 [Oleoguttula mirabilis]|uniref:M protein repeat protein n=1 Tax=Oleoguttula mirabilis TaxID=1507867 RepID=A0AAV9JNJ7_9PEZI|nr:hypothetical protein LTR36_001597 [Oleoguttula mirabilis]